MATIREDVVKISFDVEGNPFIEITNSANDMKSAITGGVDSSTSKLKTLATHAGKVAGVLGKGLVVASKAAVAGAGAAAVAVGGLVTKAAQSYGEYEQLIGGVETLFKDSAPLVQKYANDAYKTAGLSANQYMETVTSFSASLLQSVGGDTKKAAQLADTAITDMSDNANKMGTDMESIQNAYQGFAKQNYTMLDNLKLGYGGTKEEMARLVQDAAKIDKSVDANSMSYANIVKAIHAVQDNMGITGTTAKEAEQTISGSLAGMKSAWGNMLTALVVGGDSFDQSVANLVQSVKTFAGNIIPVVKSALTGVTSLITELAPVIAAELPSLVSSVLPALVNAGISLVQNLINAIQSNISMITGVAMQIITALVNFIISAAPQLIITGVQLIISLVQGIAQQLPTLIPMAIQAIMTLANSLLGMLPQIIAAGIQLIVALVEGIAQSLPTLIPMGIQALITLINGIVQAIPQLIQAALGLIPVIVNALIQNLPLLIQGGIQLLVAVITGLGQAIPQLITFLPQIGRTIIDSLKSIDLVSIGKDLISGLINGIKSMATAVWDAAKNVVSGAADAIKGFLGINSPAKLTIGYGEFTGEGLALGIQDTKAEVAKAAQGLSGAVEANITPSVNAYTPNASSVSNNSTSSVRNIFSPQFVLNMNGASATEANKRKVQQWIREGLEEMFEQMGRIEPELYEV